MSKPIVKIYFNNGCSSLLYKETTTVQEIIKYVLKGRLSQNDLRYKKCFQLRATKYSTEQKIQNFFWLPYNFTIKETLKLFENDDFDNWKILLRVRYLPSDLNEVKFKDRVTFTYFYEQIKNDFMLYKADLVDETQQQFTQIILELGCLEMRRSFQNMKPNALDKKINFEYLEKDVGLKRFFPDKLLQLKSKNIKKLIVKGIKEYENYNEEDCMLLYLEKLKNVWKYDEEIYECQLGGTWSVPIKLAINYNDGISCFMNENREPFQNVKFDKITEIYVNNDQNNSNNYLVQLKLDQTEELLTFKFNDKATACNLALLIDGFSMIRNNSELHIWSDLNVNNNASSNHNSYSSNSNSSIDKILNMHSQQQQQASPKHVAYEQIHHNNEKQQQQQQQLPIGLNTNKNLRINSIEMFDNINYDNDENACEYVTIDSCHELDRNYLDFVERLGSGQFGDVYRGTYKKKNDMIEVAIKMLKMTNEEEDRSVITNKFMQEARIMQSFDHPHIIKLIGVCSDYPALIIMELAKLGQLRKYLQGNLNQIEIPTLILYCYQLNTAMSYLESKKFVHRDIAARNILIFSPECVKLSDFGLSRAVEENFYLASKSKLPIKWLAPESINFRKFTSSSDVWMFGVCMWEILSFGEKPFQGIKNADVIHLIENKQRLEKPVNCPDELYSIMMRCWEYDPLMRPKFSQLNDIIHSIYMNYKERKVVIASSTPPKEGNFNNYDKSKEMNNELMATSAPPPKPKRINSNINNNNSKFQYPNYVSRNFNDINDLANLKISGNERDQSLNMNSDTAWLDERFRFINNGANNAQQQQHRTPTKSPTRLLSPSRFNPNLTNSANLSKDIQLRDNTYNFIQKISTFVHSLSKNNKNQQIDLELKTIVFSWNNLCDIYETYPLVSNKTTKISEIVEELDNKLSFMIDELKLNHLDKVISIALELAHNAKQLFCTIINNSSISLNNNNNNNNNMSSTTTAAINTD